TISSTSSHAAILSQPHPSHAERPTTVPFTFTNHAPPSSAPIPYTTLFRSTVALSPVTFSAAPGQAFSNQAVATFTDPGGAEPNDGSHYSATIDWGDSTPTTTGTIGFSGGVFTVRGGHTYAGAGHFVSTVTL